MVSVPARKFQGVIAGCAEKGAIVRDDEAGFLVILQKVFQKNLRAQIEKSSLAYRAATNSVRQQQRRQLHPGCQPPESSETGFSSIAPFKSTRRPSPHFHRAGRYPAQEKLDPVSPGQERIVLSR